MSADVLLKKLNGVKRTGADRWVARCPSHDDRRPSLGVRTLDDGRTLLICRAGCATAEVLAAVGLTFDALYPERAIEHRVPGEHQPLDAWNTLRSLPTELAIIIIYVSDVRAGRDISKADHVRFLTAVERIRRAAALARA
jgi:hypothetical protein